MSEYQLYEFLALDRPLSAEDLAYVRTLSSRVQPTPTQADVTYSYSSFPGDPLKLLAKHYDVMLTWPTGARSSWRFAFQRQRSTRRRSSRTPLASRRSSRLRSASMSS